MSRSSNLLNLGRRQERLNLKHEGKQEDTARLIFNVNTLGLESPRRRTDGCTCEGVSREADPDGVTPLLTASREEGLTGEERI